MFRGLSNHDEQLQVRQKFAYITKKTRSFACLVPAIFMIVHLQPFLSFPFREMCCFYICVDDVST